MTETTFEVPVGDALLRGHRGGTGRPALVLHGGPGLPDYMEPCAAELADLCTTIRYAQRGVPPSSVGAPYTVEAHISDAIAVLDALEVERAWAVGHSWGGHLALHLAAAYPERFAGIVCVDPLGASTEVLAEFGPNLRRVLSPEQAAWAEEVEQREEAGLATPEEQLEVFAAIWPGYFAHPEDAPPFPFDSFGEGNAETFASIVEHVERGTLTEGLRAVHVPALFVHGVLDPLPMRASVDTAALMPDAEVVLIEDCGHVPWLERPGELRRAVAEFFSRAT